MNAGIASNAVDRRESNGATEYSLPKARWHFIMLLLTAIYALAFVDRQIVNILAEQIKIDLKLTDWQIGALAGPAFALFYVLAGIPLARIAERCNRIFLLSGVLAVWSGFTALSGLAQTFIQLVVARIFVGASESGCVPAAHSLISDITPRAKRSTALAMFSLGLPLGSLLGLTAGGFIAEHFSWRAAFLLVGAPGLILALLLLALFRDPRLSKALQPVTRKMLTAPETQEAGKARSNQDDVPPFSIVMRQLLATPSFVWMTLAASVLSVASYGQATFYASFFLRNHASQIEELAIASGTGGPLAFLGLTLGLATGITGMIGTALGGRLGDKFASTGFKGYMTIPIFVMAVGTPLTMSAMLVPDVRWAIFLLATAAVLKSMWYGPVFATIQGLVAPRSRATAVSVFLTLMNGFGLGLGPIALGGLSDALAPQLGSADALRWSMVSFTLLVFLAAFCFWRARKRMPEDPIS